MRTFRLESLVMAEADPSVGSYRPALANLTGRLSRRQFLRLPSDRFHNSALCALFPLLAGWRFRLSPLMTSDG